MSKSRPDGGLDKLVSPKQVARAIGVSESSVKRWCDKGVIETIKTAGGHRRLRISDVVQFLRNGGHTVVHPELLGLPPSSGSGPSSLEDAREQLRVALVSGDEQVARRVVLDLYLAGHRISAIGDELIAVVFAEIGDLWDCGDVAVYQERRACELCLRTLRELRSAIGPLPETAPQALGGTLEGDHYAVAVTIAELVLRESGWNATLLGTTLPLETARAAIQDHRPKLFWASVSFIPDEARFVGQWSELHATAVECGTALVVGGRALTEPLRRQMRYTAYCDTFRQLESFAIALAQAGQ